jgi:putative flippase GtrA
MADKEENLINGYSKTTVWVVVGIIVGLILVGIIYILSGITYAVITLVVLLAIGIIAYFLMKSYKDKPKLE